MTILNIPDKIIRDDVPVSLRLCDGGDDTGFHTHSFTEVFYVVSGQIDHAFHGKERTHLTAGDMVIIPVGRAHTFYRTDGVPCAHRDICIRSDFFESVCAFVDPSLEGMGEPTAIRLSADTVRRFEQRVDRILRLLPTASDKRLPLIRALTVAIAEQILYAKTESMFDSMPAWLRKLLDDMNKPEIARQGLASIVSRYNYDPKYICRAFKKHIGVTMTEYLNCIRLTHAYNVLQSTDANIIEIANSVGFSSLSYFNSCFKKQFGITPGRVRMQK